MGKSYACVQSSLVFLLCIVLVFNVVATMVAGYLLHDEISDKDYDPGTAYNIVLTISRLIYAVQVFLTLLGLVAVCTSGYGLLVPWFFFTNVQLLQHISLFVYAIVKERYVVSGYAVAVVLGLVLTYLVALKYYKAMRMEERRRFSVAAAPSTSSVPPPPPQPAQPVFSP